MKYGVLAATNETVKRVVTLEYSVLKGSAKHRYNTERLPNPSQRLFLAILVVSTRSVPHSSHSFILVSPAHVH